MATSLTENHIPNEEFSPEPEYPVIISTSNDNLESTLPRYITLDVTFTESLSQPDLIDHVENDSHTGANDIPTVDLSQPIHLDNGEDVFTSDDKSVRGEEAGKLVDWVFNMYVPTCKSLLECCQSSSVDMKRLHQYLKLLSNSVTFFCNEHQQMRLLKESVSPSKSFTGTCLLMFEFMSSLYMYMYITCICVHVHVLLC